MHKLVFLPNLTDELLLAPFSLLAGFVMLMVVRRLHNDAEGRILVPAFLVQLLGAFAQVLVTTEYYGMSDSLGYWAEGTVLAELMRYDFFDMAPRLVQVFLHQPVAIPFDLQGQGATASQSVLSGFIQFVTGSTLYGSSMVIAYLSWLGRLGMYHALKAEFLPETRRFLLIAVLFEPSVVYWSGGHTKEASAVAFLGLLMLALRMLFDRKRIVLAALLGITCAIGVAMIKPYILLALSVAVGIWFYWRTEVSRSGQVVVKPVFVVLAAVAVLGGIIGVGKIAPEYAVDNLEKRSGTQQAAGVRARGGSYYQIVPESADRGLAGQIAYAPFALFTSLFRPLPFEANSIIVLFSSFEQLGLLMLFASAVRRIGVRRARKIIASSAALMFCVAFTLTFGTAVGLVTLNMGTLSRYRMPMMPFFAMAVLVMYGVSRGAPQPQIARLPAPVGAGPPSLPDGALARQNLLRQLGQRDRR